MTPNRDGSIRCKMNSNICSEFNVEHCGCDRSCVGGGGIIVDKNKSTDLLDFGVDYLPRSYDTHSPRPKNQTLHQLL